MSETKAIESQVEDAKAISNGSVSDLDALKQKMAEKQTVSNNSERPMQQADQSPME